MHQSWSFYFYKIVHGYLSVHYASTLLLEFELTIFLNLIGCKRLKSFPEFKENMGRLRVLDFSGIGIEEVPSSIRHLHGLEDLNLSYCQNLMSLPDSICCLISLKPVLVENCSKLGAVVNVELELCSSSLARQPLNLTFRILKSRVICRNSCFYSFKTLNPRCYQRKKDMHPPIIIGATIYNKLYF